MTLLTIAPVPIVMPVRLRLSRVRGFSLHQLSHVTNGLQARRVDRATAFGNPFRFVDQGLILRTTADEQHAAANDAAELVRMFRDWLNDHLAGRLLAERIRTELRGHNLACWCALGWPCHADVELEIANG
jgi:hypothetical protein